MNQRILLFFLALIGASSGFSQTLTLQGKVIDGLSQKEIPYVNIGFPTFGIGTASNDLGEFIIKIPYNRIKDTLFFSSIGYITFKLVPNDIKEGSKNLTIHLKTNDINLNEFVFKSLNGRKLIQTCLKKRAVNYNIEPALLQVFSRETMKDVNSDAYFVQSEGVLEVYKSSVKKYDDHVRLIKGRKKNLPTAYAYKNKVFPFPNVVNGPWTTVILDIVKNNDFFLLQNQQFHFLHTGYESINDRLAFVVNFYPIDTSIRNLLPSDYDYYKGKVYIDTATFTLVRAEFEMVNRGFHAVNSVKGNPLKLEKRTFIVNYAEYNNKNYFKSANVENIYFYPEAKLRLSHKMESLVTEIKADSVKKFDSKKELKEYESLGERISYFDDSFWDEYNFVKSSDKENAIDTPLSNTSELEDKFALEQETLPLKSLSTIQKKVVFTDLSFDNALELATKEKKALYIDFDANWCDPCKKVAEEIDSDPFIVEKLNTFFVNIKADVDKGEGYALRQKYKIDSLPTILFIDSLTHVLSRSKGFTSINSLEEQINSVLNKTEKGRYYQVFERKYNAYKKLPASFMTRFLKYRNALGMNNQILLDDYIASLPSDSLNLNINQKLILQYAVDLEGKAFDHLLKYKNNPNFLLKLKSMLQINLKDAVHEKDKNNLDKILKVNALIQEDPSVCRVENAVFIMDFYRKIGDEKHFHEAVLDFLKTNKDSPSELVMGKIADLKQYYKLQIHNRKLVKELEQALK